MDGKKVSYLQLMKDGNIVFRIGESGSFVSGRQSNTSWNINLKNILLTDSGVQN